MSVAFPYKTISEEYIGLGDWRLTDEKGDSQAVGNEMLGWDYDVNIELWRTIEINPRSMLADAGLTPDARTSVLITAETGPTSYRWVVYREDIPDQETWKREIKVFLNSSNLSQRVSLHTEIVLGCHVHSGKHFTAAQAGSRLYRATKEIQLEGSLGRFPMEMLNFSTDLPFLRAEHAMWYLDWDPARPESQFLGTVILYINSAQTDVSKLIRKADETILSIISYDVVRTMCEAMLLNDEFIDEYSSFATDTVGGQVREWLTLAFEDMSPKVLRNQFESAPARFEARLQEAFSSSPRQG